MDKEHHETDVILEKMERHLAAIYSRAGKELEAKAAEFFRDFQRLDEQKRQLLEAGAITEQEYKTWRTNKILYETRFVHFQKQFAEELLHTNETAQAYVNDQLPEVYSLNYNQMRRKTAQIKGYSFTLVSPQVVKNLATQDLQLLPYREIDPTKDIPWNMKKIQSEMLQGILQGDSIPRIAKRLRNVSDMNQVAAVRNARTMVTNVENKGRQDSYEKAQEDGVIMAKQWRSVNDSRTRHAHRKLNGQIVPIDESFHSELGDIRFPGDPLAKPANVYNCFIGETNVASDSNVIRSYKHQYSGKMVSVKTSNGVNFTCTPNHPILTPRGWVSAELLQNGDNIIVTFCGENGLLGVNPDVNHAFPSMETVHNLLNVPFSERTTSMSVNFHGDIPTSDVEIITQERLLRENCNSGLSNYVNKFLLKFPDKPFPSKCSFSKHFRGIWKPSFCNVCGKSQPFSLLRAGMRHSHVHSLRSVSNRNPLITEYSINDLPANSIIDGELLDRLSGRVFIDQIADVKTFISSCHVYNLQTDNGYYFVNNIIAQNNEKYNGIMAIAKNCRCTLKAKVLGFKPTLTDEQRKRVRIK